MGCLIKRFQLSTGTSFSPGDETKMSWPTPTDWSLGCRRPGRAKVPRMWFLGYSRHGLSGSCKPIGCPGSSGCSPCPPTVHWWTFCLQRTCTAMTTPGDTIGLRHHLHSPPPIDQTTVYQKLQLGTGVQFSASPHLGWPQISNISEELRFDDLMTRKKVNYHFGLN